MDTKPLDDEHKLREKLRRIEALFSGATTPGERDAAAAAAERIRKRLAEVARVEPAIEYKFSLSDGWTRKLMVALCRRYGLEPYRLRGQRRTTLMVRAPRSFVESTLWPQFQQISAVLQEYLNATTERIIREEVYKDASEARER